MNSSSRTTLVNVLAVTGWFTIAPRDGYVCVELKKLSHPLRRLTSRYPSSRKEKMMRAAPVLLLVLCFAGTLQAENVVGFTAEWLAHQSQVIATGVPTEVENIRGPGEVWFTKARFKLADVIKGPVTPGDQITVFDYAYKQSDVLELAKANKAGRSLLVFATTAEHLFQEIDGKYVLTNAHEFKSAYLVDQPVTKLFTPEFKLLVKYDELVKRARQQSEAEARRQHQYWMGKVVRKSLKVPGDAEIYALLDGGSAVDLWYPEFVDDEK
jgi:hypothetical protein